MYTELSSSSTTFCCTLNAEHLIGLQNYKFLNFVHSLNKMLFLCIAIHLIIRQFFIIIAPEEEPLQYQEEAPCYQKQHR